MEFDTVREKEIQKFKFYEKFSKSHFTFKDKLLN